MLSPSKVHFLKQLFRGIILQKDRTAIDFNRIWIKALGQKQVTLEYEQNTPHCPSMCAGKSFLSPCRTKISWCYSCQLAVSAPSLWNGLAASASRKTALKQQTPAPGLGGFLSPNLLFSLKKSFDLLVLHHLSHCTLVRREWWNSRPPCLLALGVRFGLFSFSIQMSFLDLNRSAL